MTAYTKNKSILIVDDDEDIRETISQVLQFGGYQTTKAIHGLDALEALQRTPLENLPGLIILDLMMPIMDGAQFLERLQAQEIDTIRKIPVILASAKGSLSNEPEVIQNVERIKKPIDIDDLYQMVAKHCGTP